MAKKHDLADLKGFAKTHWCIPELVNQFRKREISRREFLQTSTALGLSAFTAYKLAGGMPQAQAATPRKGGEMRWAMKMQELKDPQNFEWIESSNVSRGVCEYLTVYGSDAEVRPYLAERWEVSDDIKTYDFHLRRGIKWSNGDDFTADDVVHNFERWRAPDSESINKSEWGDGVLSGIEKVDDHRVRFHLVAPDVSVPHRMYAYPTQIVHRSFDDTGADIVKNPVGTGPFNLEYFQVGEGARLTRRDDYWGGPDGGGPAYLDSVQFVDLGEDEQASVSAFAANQVDWIYKVSGKQLDTLKRLPGTQVLDVPTGQTGVVRFRLDEYGDSRVRQAIINAADNAELLRVAYRDLGIVAENHHTGPFQPDYHDLGFRPRQDLAKAAELIEAAGMKGKEISITVGNTQGTWEQDVCQVLKEQCAKAGISININLLPAAQYWEVWDTNPFGLTFWTHRPLAIMLHKLAYHSGAKWNETAFRSDRYDDALASAIGSPNPAEASKHMRVCQEELLAQSVMVQPFWIQAFTAGSGRVKNFPVHQQDYYPAHRIWLEG